MKPYLALSLLCLAPGCSLVVDGTLSGRTMDAGPSLDAPTSGCAVAADGARCTIAGLLENHICIAGLCVPSSCGDGFVESRNVDGMTSETNPVERCDDGNGTSGDGCDSDCTYSCDADPDCADGLLCNGDETCDTASHTCTAGTPVADGVTCTVESTTAMCMSGVCRAGVCPDGTVDPGEACDDDNTTDGDGCDADCTFSCETDTDCQDATACNGSETCDTVSHTCAPGTAPDCDDADPCTTDGCSPDTGCTFVSVFVDNDRDGYTAAMAGAPAECASDDCDDADENTHPGAPEMCGGVDTNCDGSTATPTYYPDCDRDGYAPAGAAGMTGCAAPSAPPSSCSTGTWTTTSPTVRADCADTDARAYPGATSYYTTTVTGRGGYDFNCDGSASPQFPIGRPTRFTECGGASCTGTSYIIGDRTTSCGRQSTPYPTLSHCETNLLICSRVTDPISNIACR